MDNLVKSFKESIFVDSEEKIEQILDIIEEPVDVLSENPIIKAVPVVKSVALLAKSCLAIRDRILIKNLMTFIASMNDGTIEREKLEKYKKKLDNNPKILNRDLEKVLIFIERESEQDKIKILAQLYKSYINENINWDEFKHYSEITNNLFIIDIGELRNLYDNKLNDNNYTPIALSRLSAIGLVNYGTEAIFDEKTENLSIGKVGEINYLGKKYYKYGVLNSGIEFN